MLSKWIRLFFSGSLICLIIGFLFLPTHVLAFNGPHKISTNECDICHIPHHAADEMLWARTTTGPFAGVRRLCATCHGVGLYGAKDRFGIFESEGDETYDHLMNQHASINGISVIRRDWTPFPLKEKEGGDGFYCGSCHDPHLDPYEPIDDQGGGDYLRQEKADLIKDVEDKETAFCTQCHDSIIFGDAFGHGNKKGCYDCHHPHDSRNPGSKILISPLIPFTAIPNCQGFTDFEETAAACYGCHREGAEFDGALGAPLAGDDLSVPKEHHPMGQGADVSTSGHQPTQTGTLSPSGELYCASCHTVHNGTNDHYLNPQIVLDYDPTNSAIFCIACHSNKTIEDLGPRGEGHHQVSPNNQCLFCHSIHNAPDDPDALFQTDEDEADLFNSSVSVDVIMRIPPENLAWSDKTLDTDTKDYEDACYGCHSRPDIVGKEFSLNEENALLLDNVRDRFFSHRFNVTPSPGIRLINTFDDRLPIVSDGQETETINDYGVEEGRIWCGSCHSVHKYERFSTGIHEDYKERRSAYLRAENYRSSLCYRCHIAYHEDLGIWNHPQDEEGSLTLLKNAIPRLYYEGYSGGIGGITNGDTAFDTAQGEVVCQTCHSVHTAETDWDGGSNEDDLLDHGRLLVKSLNDGFCQDCHPYVEKHPTITEKCISCHSPHHGIKLSTDPNNRFIASPNVTEINDIDDPTIISSASCYTCHQANYLKDNNFWIERGAAPIFGDYIEGEYNMSLRKNHHPMGLQAKLKNGKFLHAPGDEATRYLVKEEITCVSCHADIHGVIVGKNYYESKDNNFLRWDFTNDNALFCLKCHSDKLFENSQISFDRKHFWNTNSLLNRIVFSKNNSNYKQFVSCRQCMFCHFIHDGKEYDDEGPPVSPYIEVLMRVEPKNLAWGDRETDNDINDYEDMCFGCHGESSIVGNGCLDGSLLRWRDDLHTHRFASPPDPNNPPFNKITYGGTFPKSDGEEDSTKNDYGTAQNSIYCGTCHNVHNNKVNPYLNHESSTSISPYLPKPNGFCEECHDADSDQFNFVHNSHPIDEGPNYPATAEKWPELYFSGESGCKGGVTIDKTDSGEIICLTCHNVHAAATDWKGQVSSSQNNTGHGKLLVRDNLSTQDGSDMCKDCHNFEKQY